MGAILDFRINRWQAIGLFGCLTLFLLTAVMPALAQIPVGTILGVVKDSSGGVVPHATVTITNNDTNQVRTAETGDDGAFYVAAMPVGHYNVKAEHEGFKTETQTGLVLDVSQQAVINFTLQVGTSSQEVVVTGEAPLVNTTTTNLGGLVNEEKMADLPLNGRNYIDLSLMQSGVSKSANIGSGGGVAGTFFSSNGLPVRSNNITMDGAPMVNQMGGSSSSEAGTTLGVDGIKEFKVITNTVAAEYGMVVGSQMVIVSKGGSNQFHGDVFEYLRNSSLDARNFFDTSVGSGGRRLPEFQRNNFGGSLGGPIRKDKTFFYGVYEGLKQNLGFTAFDTVMPASCHNATNIVDSTCDSALASGATEPVAPVIIPLLALFPSPNVPNTGNYSFPTTSTSSVNFGQMRVDQNISTSDTFFTRYTVDDSSLNNANTGTAAVPTGVAFPQFRVEASSRSQFLTLAENHIFSSSLLNTVRLSFSRTGQTVSNLIPSNLLAPQYSFVPGVAIGSLAISGFSTLGSSATFGPPPQDLKQNIYTLSDDLYYSMGKHAFKFGTLINRYNEGMYNLAQGNGSVTFPSLQKFIMGIPNTYKAGTPGFNLNHYMLYSTFGFYAQDDWRATSRLTINAGLRSEFMTNPRDARSYALHDLTQTTATPGPIMSTPVHPNFSPRLGLAWDVTGKGKTSIRSGFGLYYDVGNIGALLTQHWISLPPISGQSSVNNTANQVMTLPLAFPPGVSSLFTTDYNAHTPRTFQYNLTVEQQLPGGVGLSVSYVGTHALHLWEITEGNPVIPSIVNGVEYWNTSFPREFSKALNAANNNNISTTFLTTGSSSSYNGLQVNVNKRLSHGLEFQAAYTYSKVLDLSQGQMNGNDCSGAAGETNGVDPLFPQNDKGPACFDVANNLRLNVLYHFPNLKGDSIFAKALHGWQIGSIISVQSGYPFSPLLSTNRSESGALAGGPDRTSIVTSASSLVKNFGTTMNPNNYTYNFVPFDPSTVITGNPLHWFNPLMFNYSPMVTCPAPNAALTCGTLGNVARGLLRGPGLGTWDLKVAKFTPVPMLGERGGIEFRAELFNVLNRANFGMPSGTAYSGAIADAPFKETPVGATAASPLGTAGQITTTSTTSRQIQLAIKVIF